MAQNSSHGINSVINEAKDLFPEIPKSPSPYIFFSFDLVNSTIYKNKQQEEWPAVFTQFFQVIIEEMKSRFQGIKVWKYIGDEILFFKPLNSRDELFEALPCAFQALNHTLENLQKAFPSIFKPLSLKGTIWFAPVMFIEGQELLGLKMGKMKNIAFEIISENDASLIDFMGPDIDIGFRISKYTEKGKLVISADLAYMLFTADSPGLLEKKKKNLVSNLKIVSYEDLKGIWDDRFYPVIWYYEDWSNIKNSFAYDDHFKSRIINNIYLKCFEELKELPGIFQQLELREEKDKLLEILEHAEKIAQEKTKEKPGIQIPIIAPSESS